MNLNKLEKELKDFTSGSQEKIDTHELWNRVEPHIIKKKKFGFRVPLIMMSTLLLMSLAGLFMYSQTEHSELVITSDKRSEQNDIDPKGMINSVNKNLNSEQPSVNDFDQNQAPETISSHDVERIQSEDNQTVTQNKIARTSEGQVEQNSSIQEIRGKEKSSSSDGEIATDNQLLSPNFNATNQLVTKQADLSAQNVKGHSPKFKSEVTKVQEENSNFSSSTEPVVLQEANHLSQAEKVNKLGKLGQNLEINPGIDFKPKVALQPADDIHAAGNQSLLTSKETENLNRLSPDDQLTLPFSDETNLKTNDSRLSIQVIGIPLMVQHLEVEASLPTHFPKRVTPYMRRQFPKVSFEMGGSYLLPQKEFTIQDNERQKEYTSRELAEEVLEAWFATATVRYHLTPNWGIGVGVHYGSINERSVKTLNYSETVFLRDTIVGNLVRIDGAVDPIYGDIEIDRTVTKKVSRINSYAFIQLPIELMYKHPVDRLNVEFGLGVIQNIRFSASGFWHPDAKTEYDLSKDPNGYIKSKLGLGLTGRVGLAYDITPAIGVYAHSRYIKYLSGVTNSNYGIEQKYAALGAEFGVRYHFFN